MVQRVEGSRLEKTLVVVGIVVLSFNLRPAAVSIGPVLDEIQDGLGMSAGETGLLTTLPVLCFAIVGAIAPRLSRLVGLHRVTLLSLVLLTLGLWWRSEVHSPDAFLALSFLALSGMAVANVLLPSLVKLHFPNRIGLMTSVYTTSLAIGLTTSSVATVPIAQFGDGVDWRLGLSVWALTAVVAAVPWIGLVRHDRLAPEGPKAIGLRDVARTRLGWAVAIFFGMQSLHAYVIFGWFAQLYRDAGFSARTAGLLLGVITGIGIPLSFVLPLLASRLRNQVWLVAALILCYPVGYLGLLFAADKAPLLWAIIVGVAVSVFPVVMTLISLRTRSSVTTSALSGFAQSVGYLISSAGPLGVGFLYGASGSWTLPLVALLVLCVPLLVAGVLTAKDLYLDDEIAQLPPRVTKRRVR